MNKSKKGKIRSLICNFGCLILLSLSIGSCNYKNEKLGKETKTSSIQSYIDSCANLYSMAIYELKQGHSKEEVKSKYANRIISLHSRFSKSFDSITLLYTNEKITQVEYDNVMQSLVLDSVASKSEELSRLGVNIELK